MGMYPLCLELGVETTYPVEETISSAFILMVGQLEGVVLVALIDGLATEQRPEYAHLQVCSSESDTEVVPKDYTREYFLENSAANKSSCLNDTYINYSDNFNCY